MFKHRYLILFPQKNRIQKNQIDHSPVLYVKYSHEHKWTRNYIIMSYVTSKIMMLTIN